MKASNYIGVLARVYLGISFFFSDHGNAQPNEAARFLKFALKNGYSCYQSLLNSVVVPHAAIFAKLVVIGEIYIGIALVVGFTTRFASGLLYFAGLVTAAITRNERYHEFYAVFFLVQTIVISFLIFQILV